MMNDNVKNIETVKPSEFLTDKLKLSLPNFFTNNGTFDLNRFKKELESENINFDDEDYSLNFLGKNYGRLQAGLPTITSINADNVHNEQENNVNSENVYIVGDNLDGLKHLREDYYEKIKCIYIDPPYNTGSDGFVYKDNFSFTIEDLMSKSGMTEIEAKKILKLQGRSSHSAWLTFMLPRLMIARELLTIDGAIFISIDQNEMKNLQLLCDEIFGEQNFIGDIIWAGGRKNDGKYLSKSHEYVLIYAKDESYLSKKKIKWRSKKKGLNEIYRQEKKLRKEYETDYDKATQMMKNWYTKLPPNSNAKNHKCYCTLDEHGLYRGTDLSWPGSGGHNYDIKHPITGKNVKKPSRGWIYSEEKMQVFINENRIIFGKDETTIPNNKKYLHEMEYETFYSVINKTSTNSIKNLTNLMGAKVFQFPKDTDVLAELIGLVATGENDIILDFFSGSGSTAHATLKMNTLDNKKRKFIAIQSPEIISDKEIAYNEGYRTIDELGIERIKRVAQQIEQEYIVFTDNIESSALRVKNARNDTSERIPDTGFKIYYLEQHL